MILVRTIIHEGSLNVDTNWILLVKVNPDYEILLRLLIDCTSTKVNGIGFDNKE